MVTLISRLIWRKINIHHRSYTLYSIQSISVSSVTFSLSPAKRTSTRSSSTSSSNINFPPRTSVHRENCDFDKSRPTRSKFKHEFDNQRHNEEREKIIQIVGLIKNEETDIESKLYLMDLTLSYDLVCEIFGILNHNGVSGLRFFRWINETQFHLKQNSEFCSLIIDNLGRIEDYESMLIVLKDFSSKGICLTEKAFAFLPVSCSDGFELRVYVKKVIETLNMAGGSSRGSGIYALIKMFCTLNYFDLAIYVMEETTRKTSYYNVLIWAKCRYSKFEEAQELFDEMKRFGCDPNSNSYNYLLGSLCKNGKISEACNLVDKMDECGYLPDAITFEIFIYHASRHGRLDFAIEFLNQMIYRNLEPRLTTHAAFIKGYFHSNRFHEAYKYVIDMSAKYRYTGNVNYSLLASLHHKKGRLLEARELLVVMIEKGLKPNFPIYIKVMKDLHKSGMGHLVADLKNRYSKFNSSTKA